MRGECREWWEAVGVIRVLDQPADRFIERKLLEELGAALHQDNVADRCTAADLAREQRFDPVLRGRHDRLNNRVDGHDRDIPQAKRATNLASRFGMKATLQ